MPVIGDGIDVGASTLGRGAGIGLIATRQFRSGQYITFVARHRADHLWPRRSGRTAFVLFLERSDVEQLPRTSHIVYCPAGRISGLRVPRNGVGGGSFINHSDDPNAVFHYIEGPNIYVMVRRGRTIRAGEEIFVNYFVPGLSGVELD